MSTQDWIKRNRELHAAAGELGHPEGAHVCLKEMALDKYPKVISLADLNPDQQEELLKDVRALVRKQGALVTNGRPRPSQEQISEIVRVAYDGLGWDSKRLSEDLKKVHGLTKLSKLTPAEASNYIQRLRLIKKHGKREK